MFTVHVSVVANNDFDVLVGAIAVAALFLSGSLEIGVLFAAALAHAVNVCMVESFLFNLVGVTTLAGVFGDTMLSASGSANNVGSVVVGVGSYGLGRSGLRGSGLFFLDQLVSPVVLVGLTTRLAGVDVVALCLVGRSNGLNHVVVASSLGLSIIEAVAAGTSVDSVTVGSAGSCYDLLCVLVVSVQVAALVTFAVKLQVCLGVVG